VLAAEALPGTPELDANRVAVFARVKGEPALFVRKPSFDPNVPRDVRRFRGVLTTTAHPWDYLKLISSNFAAKPELGRATILRDGYLYAENPNLAYALVDHVRAHDLFDDARVWIQRGEKTVHAKRQDGRYVYESGPQQGEAVQLFLFDRIGTGEPPPAVHRDVRSLRSRLHFDRFETVRLTEHKVLANLHYGGMVVPTILKSDGPRLDLDCELVESGQGANLTLHRERAAKLERVVQGLRSAIVAQIDEQLPFDEPRTEAGQQDGFLRMKWQGAYLQGSSKYELNGDEYQVFDRRGRPLVPQVCVDFLMDTFERASGTWWRSRAGQRGRDVGKLDFQALVPAMPRRIPDFVEFARSKPEWFDVYDTPERERVAFRKGHVFYKNLVANADRYRPGDIVIIRGYTPFERKWERPVMHYHSFFVYENDPITSVPIVIVGNAGRPSLRTWEFEVRRTPKRSIWHRVRPHLNWLEQVVDPATAAGEPPPLTVGPPLG
jgi:hypothetical protein